MEATVGTTFRRSLSGSRSGDATIRITGTKSKLLRVLAGGEAGPPHLGAGHSSAKRWAS